MTTEISELVRALRGWAKAYRDTPEHRFPSDPDAEFFPLDLDCAAEALERSSDDLRKANGRINLLEQERDAATAEHARCSEHSAMEVQKREFAEWEWNRSDERARAAEAEVADLKHDIERHLKIASDAEAMSQLQTESRLRAEARLAEIEKAQATNTIHLMWIQLERERCAKIADEMREKYGSPTGDAYSNGLWDQSIRIAQLIRHPVSEAGERGNG